MQRRLMRLDISKVRQKKTPAPNTGRTRGRGLYSPKTGAKSRQEKSQAAGIAGKQLEKPKRIALCLLLRWNHKNANRERNEGRNNNERTQVKTNKAQTPSFI
eukprot:TRINITY_DN1908_c0_g1_i4.p1 TRINITY_DN1908_c0_g1~~TRINITY_DN1908_c0_g1_i4.p1  ORF type:complete len:102 (+),score=6.31 TRINITY_DN1908_c0_g1_i4:333-638(+)